MYRRDAFRISVGVTPVKESLRRSRRRWEDNIKMDFQEIILGKWTGFM
jgi:hypothetical protein